MNIRKELFAQSPYKGFPIQKFSYSAEGWNSDSPIFKKLITQLRPSLIIEVGSWKGASAITMGKAAQELGINCEIVCVDTWLGALEFWLDKNDPQRYLALNLLHGYPQVYYQFLANMIHQKLDHMVTPFPQTSLIAARWLNEMKIKSRLIYIDASHDEPDVYEDITAYWNIVEPGGVLFGDDYAPEYWPGVVKAVNRFAKEKGLKVEVENHSWIIRKMLSDVEETVSLLTERAVAAKVSAVAVYGAGAVGRGLIPALHARGIEVACVVDSNPALTGSEIETGKHCQAPKSLLNHPALPVVIASKAFISQIEHSLQSIYADQLPMVISVK